MSTKRKYTYIDLFAGTSALSEGFLQCGFQPVSHIEMNSDACLTIKTRTAYHYLKNNNKLREKKNICPFVPLFPLKKDENQRQIKEKVIRNTWDMGQNN